jgi:hypothetical protein
VNCKMGQCEEWEQPPSKIQLGTSRCCSCSVSVMIPTGNAGSALGSLKNVGIVVGGKTKVVVDHPATQKNLSQGVLT